MREPAFRQQVVRFDGAVDVALVDADRHPHQHVLRAFHDFAVDAQQVGPFEGFEAKIVVIKVAHVDDFAVEPVGVFRHDGRHVVRHQRGGVPVFGVDVGVHELDTVV